MIRRLIILLLIVGCSLFTKKGTCIVDDIGGDTSNTTTTNSEGGETGGMESFDASDGASSDTYYIPYKKRQFTFINLHKYIIFVFTYTILK